MSLHLNTNSYFTAGNIQQTAEVQKNAGKIPLSENQLRVNQLAQSILEKQESLESSDSLSCSVKVSLDDLEAATEVFKNALGKGETEITKKQFINIAASLTSKQILEIKETSMQSALAVAKQFANQMKESMLQADPSTPDGCKVIRELTAIAATLNATSITANNLGGDSSWNIATIVDSVSTNQKMLSLTMNTVASTLGILVTATDFAVLTASLAKYQSLSRELDQLNQKLSQGNLNSLERHELEGQKQTIQAELSQIRQERFSASNLADKVIGAGVNTTYFASAVMTAVNASKAAITTVGAHIFGGFLIAQGVKGLIDDTTATIAMEREIQGLNRASESLKKADLPATANSCAKDLIALKSDHAKKAGRFKRVLSFIKNAIVVVTGVAALGVLGGPIGLAVCLSLSLAVRGIEALINNWPDITSFFSSLPDRFSAENKHPRNQLNQAEQTINKCHLEIDSLNKQIQVALTQGNFGQIRTIQSRLSEAQSELGKAEETKEKALVQLNQAKLACYISGESQSTIQSLMSNLESISDDSKALESFKNFAKEHLGLELSGSKNHMYNQIADFVLKSPDWGSTLAQVGSKS